MVDKYGLIDKLIEDVDELADARGARRCVLIINIIKALAELKRGLMDDDKRVQAAVDKGE